MIDARAIRQSLGLVTASAMYLIGSTALARDADRWPRVSEAEWNKAERDDRSPGSIQFLTATDRMRLAEMRVQSAIIEAGTASLSLLGGRARSQKAGEGGQIPFDRFSIKEAGLAAHAELAPGFALAVTGNYSLMKRRPDCAWASERRLSTRIASAGLALSNPSGNRVAVDYLSISRGSRAMPARMAEVMGGAPLAGTGIQISLSGKGELAGRRFLSWTVSGASLSRRKRDSDMLGERITGTDHRLSFNLHGTF